MEFLSVKPDEVWTGARRREQRKGGKKKKGKESGEAGNASIAECHVARGHEAHSRETGVVLRRSYG